MAMRNAPVIAVVMLGAMLGASLVDAESDWVWATHDNRGDRRHSRRAFRTELQDEYVGHRGDRYRSQREREPTTRRPDIAGGAVNEEIDDYPDPSGNTGTRNYSPYFPGGYNAGQVAGGYPNYNGGGFGGGGLGGGAAPNGVLVGPGGPTGIIGRPPPYFPGGGVGGGYPQQGVPIGGIGGYGPGTGQLPLGPGGGGIVPGQAGGIGFGGGGGGGFPGGYPAQGGNFGTYGAGQPPIGFGAGGNGAFPGGYPAQGQLPGDLIGGGGQYPGGQFPTAGFPGANGAGQYPGQFPTGGGAGGPQYTEGYGLAYLNSLNPFGGYAGYGSAGYDEYDRSKDKLRAQGKGAGNEIEERSLSAVSATSSATHAGQKVDDKISKTFKKA